MSDASLAPENPQNLLAHMERLLAALNADLVQLDADLQVPLPNGDAGPILTSTSGSPAGSAAGTDPGPLGSAPASGIGLARPVQERPPTGSDDNGTSHR